VIGVARVAVLDMRTVAPYRVQGMLLFGFVLLIDFKNPIVLIPALVLLVSAQIAAHPFSIADKAGLETLYAVLPVSRRSVLYGPSRVSSPPPPWERHCPSSSHGPSMCRSPVKRS
jgi:hypothetical protein